jgi:hypothetical protein
MANPTDELRTAMLERLAASEAFSQGVNGRIAATQRAELPCAWVGVTVIENGTEDVSLVATVHFLLPAGESNATELLLEAKAIFAEPPERCALTVTCWLPGYSEIRLNEEFSAHHALVRFCAGVPVR